MKKETTRIHCNVTTELKARVEEYADNMNINVTSAIAVLLSQALDMQKAMTDFSEFVKMTKENK